MFITLSPFVKMLLILILTMLGLINGYKWEQNHKALFKNPVTLQYLLRNPEQIKGCKL